MKIKRSELKQIIQEELSDTYGAVDEGWLDKLKGAVGMGGEEEPQAEPPTPADPQAACKSECDTKFQDAIAKTDGQARFSRKYHKCMEECTEAGAQEFAQSQAARARGRQRPQPKYQDRTTSYSPRTDLAGDPEFWAQQVGKDKKARAGRAARTAATDPSGLSPKRRAQRDACSARGLTPGSRDCKNYLAGLRSVGRTPGQYVSEGTDLYSIVLEELQAVLAERINQ